MSRSYKRHAWAGDTKGKEKKRDASSKVRMFLKNLDHELQNSDYKKVYETWDICDYGNTCTWEEWWEYCQKRRQRWPDLFKEEPNKKEEYRKWYKWYKMK